MGKDTVDILKRLLRGVEFIEGHLDQALSLERVAREAAVSSYHFHRLFRAWAGIPVMEYARSRRLTLAAEQLIRSELRILEISQDAGFESQEAFTRAFRRMYGTSPAAYRRNGVHRASKSVQRLGPEVLNLIKKGNVMEPKQIRRGRFWVAGLAEVYDSTSRAGIPDLWDRFIGQMKECQGRVGTHSYGVCDEQGGGREGEFEYMAAIEVTDPREIPRGWKAKEVPAGEYLEFTHRGPISQITRTVDYLWGTWLPSSKYRLRRAPDLEMHDGRFKREASDSEVDILVPVES